MHSVCENLLLEKEFNPTEYFQLTFLEELKKLKNDNVPLRKDMVVEMRQQGQNICQYVMPAVKEYFSEFEVVSVEEQIMEEIDEFASEGLKFKGFIDLVVKTPDGKYHIIDWKSCSWGWDMKLRSDSITTYQLTLYKHFFAKKHNIDLKDIETHFALLKRTAKKDNVELFRVTSGDRKRNNALKLLEKAVKNINEENFVKNKMSCSRCDYYKTPHCP